MAMDRPEGELAGEHRSLSPAYPLIAAQVQRVVDDSFSDRCNDPVAALERLSTTHSVKLETLLEMFVTISGHGGASTDLSQPQNGEK
jgi:hypothetical protein